MRFSKAIFITGILAVTGSQPAWSQGVVQQVGPNGSVDYSRRVVTSTGIGMPGGVGGRAGLLRAAKLNALVNILETINGIALTSSTTVQSMMTSSDVVKTRVEGIARNYRMVGAERDFGDGSVEVTIEMSLDGPFLEAVLPEKMGGMAQPLSSAGTGVVYTGLIIDASGLGARPALAPRIVDEQGQEVYGSSYISRQWAIMYGMAGYVKDMASAVNNDRVANHPLTARALRVSGTNNSDLVISDADARALHSMRDNLSFLEKCRVIIIVN
jgi:hypothetical protein